MSNIYTKLLKSENENGGPPPPQTNHKTIKGKNVTLHFKLIHILQHFQIILKSSNEKFKNSEQKWVITEIQNEN